jgi:UDPglucose 6-dehydrogenase
MMKVGFIGQGFIGKSMADDFEERGFEVVRYALEKEYVSNREAIAGCDVVFIAVPTPTTPKGFDCSILEAVLPLVGVGKVVIIKSTIVPGTTRRLQAMFPEIIVIHSPEFLREKHAVNDARKPPRTILGLPNKNKLYTDHAESILSILPESPYKLVCTAEEAELVKYGGNTFLAMKVVYMNLIYDLAQATGANYDVIAEAMSADSRIGDSHIKVIDSSLDKNAVPGRGAGGHCFPKDLAALREFYARSLSHDNEGISFLEAIEKKNKKLLTESKKDLELLINIYED